MPNETFMAFLNDETDKLKQASLYKTEAVINSPQNSKISIQQNSNIINFCANNYLGLSNNQIIKKNAKDAIDKYGYGMSSVRFICGTQTPHKELEARISNFLDMEDTILYPSCFDANGGLFETILTAEDAVISDQLNHASIIDGIRLSKAKRYRYKNNDMYDLEQNIIQANKDGARFILIATDGVFSMDGIIANLPDICNLADKYNALVMIDDCHATGFMGKDGKGTHQYHDVMGRVDIITSTLGKALGGASGGFTSAKKEIVSWLRQKSRPYLFSNTIAPMIATASIEALNIIENDNSLIESLHENTNYFRNKMIESEFNIIPGSHPIVPVMFNDAKVAAAISEKLLSYGVLAVSFSYPVVPQNLARIRVQISAAHTKEQIDYAVSSFIKARDNLLGS